MINNRMELFEVSRNEYASFIRCLKKGAVRYKEETEGYVKINQVISNSRDIVLCARVENKDEDIGEKYYIFEPFNEDEYQEPEPVHRVVLETPEQVQKLFDALSKLDKEKEND